MTVRWVNISNSARQQLVANLNHVVRVEIAAEAGQATLVALQNGELKVIGFTRESATVECLNNLVQGSPDQWLPVEARDSLVPGPGWANLSLVAIATLAANQVELFAADGTWLGTATEPHAVMLAKRAFK